MQPLAQPPRKDDRSFDDWMYRLWKRIAAQSGLAWDLVSKVGSNLTDIETRNHADLQNINTASYTHLTATNHTDLTDGGVTTLHKHDLSALNDVNISAVSDGQALLYNTATSKWINGTVSGGGGSPNLDGGLANSTYGGISPIEGGGA